MKFRNNRFAVVPVMCNECQQYIFLESYRKREVFNTFADRFLTVRICKSCSTKFRYGSRTDKNR